ncbi:peptidyl-prolyl cis-trans isomerase CYP26-2, chloroplastic [Neltuma alba]|uniref:peptidyl-prolyl cis-trans isomerase CYP26-2, chloroplastic n=1 Tax=Neltuma alba TaxID=207710 RepID=UPI0010A33C95|nr:peptidyl-prolyl cis-trans isomerase CYP26-2, chloroplastic [Prosopis alba]XP_028763625.1 peptidyl-prolyl cis-trans isomerase CYP26-2, chloroplastic [Prosopis alba]
MLHRLHKALQSSQPLSVPSPTLLPSSPSRLHPPPPTSSPSLPILNLQCRLSRRQLTLCSSSCLLLLLGAHGLPLPPSLRAQESDQTAENPPVYANGCTERKPTKTVFFDISIDGEPAGRITMGLYGDDVPTGVDRFSKIVSGAAGISYRRKEFIKIMPNYVQHGGLRSYGVDAELANRSGTNFGRETLVEEWERAYEGCPGTKNLAGSVGIIVRDPSKPPPKLKLVAKKGKLEIDQEEVGVEPNGTEFVIATKDSPELDASALVIGRVVEGMEVVKRIAQVKTVQENAGSPYFRVAKLIGDKRAVVAERGFNRPYLKVVVTDCGVLE